MAITNGASFWGRDVKVKFSTAHQASPITSFVPSLSALDIQAGGWGASVQSRMNLTPFDAVFGNGSRNLAHSVMSTSIANSLVLEFDKSRDAHLERKSAAYAAVF